jgi:hypothetical protein
VCCAIYSPSMCLPASKCPKACTDSVECDTADGEICCTTVGAVEPNLNVTGLCLNPTTNPGACPGVCTQSMDCNTAANEICCDGLCSDKCPKSCQSTADCPNQICCKSALNRLPKQTTTFSASPRCTGTPRATTCSSYSSSAASCNAVPG